MIILNDEKRKLRRKPFSINARVEIKVDEMVTWNEVTPLNDISALGAGFTLERPVKPGRLMLLTIPMPREFRSYDFRKEDYNIWGLIRRCIKLNDRSGKTRYSVGAAFIGRTPPDEYKAHPGTYFVLADKEPESDGFWRIVPDESQKVAAALKYDNPRRQTRLQIPEEVTIELMDTDGWPLATETTVTKNISSGGAAVYTQLDADVGSFIRLSSDRHGVKIISIVRGKNVGQGGVSRINLEFIDMPFPIDLIG